MSSDFIEDFAETWHFLLPSWCYILFSIILPLCKLGYEILKYQAYLYSFEISCHCVIKWDYPEFPYVTFEFLHGSPFNLNSFKAQMFPFLCSLQCGIFLQCHTGYYWVLNIRIMKLEISLTCKHVFRKLYGFALGQWTCLYTRSYGIILTGVLLLW
jgi:hypothetical protein